MTVSKKKELEELKKISLTIVRKILRSKLQLLWNFSAISLSVLDYNSQISADLPHISLNFVQLPQQKHLLIIPGGNS